MYFFCQLLLHNQHFCMTDDASQHDKLHAVLQPLYCHLDMSELGRKIIAVITTISVLCLSVAAFNCICPMALISTSQRNNVYNAWKSSLLLWTIKPNSLNHSRLKVFFLFGIYKGLIQTRIKATTRTPSTAAFDKLTVPDSEVHFIDNLICLVHVFCGSANSVPNVNYIRL